MPYGSPVPGETGAELCPTSSFLTDGNFEPCTYSTSNHLGGGAGYMYQYHKSPPLQLQKLAQKHISNYSNNHVIFPKSIAKYGVLVPCLYNDTSLVPSPPSC